MSITIVAFLQNPWFPPGTAERHITHYRDNQDFHRRLLGNTMSGRRLESAFGELWKKIHWDNTNWRPAWQANGRVEPDIQYMCDRIKQLDPELVLCFGNQARDAMRVVTRLASWGKEFLTCHHPNARFRTQGDLDLFARGVLMKVEEIEKRKLSV